MNLTAITAPQDVATLHLLDCAALLTMRDLRGKRVIDVGTGAGFPGMVLRILEPDFDLTLLDSLGKRIDFLKEVCSQLGLARVDWRPRPSRGVRRRTPGSSTTSPRPGPWPTSTYCASWRCRW